MTTVKNFKQIKDKKYLPNDIYSQKLLNSITELINKDKDIIDIEKVKYTISFCKKWHDRQKRDSGEPFYSHPLAVANMIVEYVPTSKIDVIISSILHDVVEDTNCTIELIKREFGNRVAEIVFRLTRVFKKHKLTTAESLSVAYQNNDKEVLLIKLFDRFHNMQTINVKSKEKKNKKAKDTLINILIIAEMLELPEITERLYNICYDITADKQKEYEFSFNKPFSLLCFLDS